MHILIVEQNPALGAMLQRSLSPEATSVELAAEVEEGWQKLIAREPDLLLLDGSFALPGKDSSMLAASRELVPACSILVLLQTSDDRAACLEQGADDCMARPLSLRELRARCRALLRRQQLHQQEMEAKMQERNMLTLRVGGLAVQRTRRQAEWKGTPLHLTQCEFGLLEQLMLMPGNTVERSTLRSTVWAGRVVETNALDVHMGALRRKLSREGAPAIETVRGIGYRLKNSGTGNMDVPCWSAM